MREPRNKGPARREVRQQDLAAEATRIVDEGFARLAQADDWRPELQALPPREFYLTGDDYAEIKRLRANWNRPKILRAIAERDPGIVIQIFDDYLQPLLAFENFFLGDSADLVPGLSHVWRVWQIYHEAYTPIVVTFLRAHKLGCKSVLRFSARPSKETLADALESCRALKILCTPSLQPAPQSGEPAARIAAPVQQHRRSKENVARARDRAVSLVAEHPESDNREIAAMMGEAPSFLSRPPAFKAKIDRMRQTALKDRRTAMSIDARTGRLEAAGDGG